MNLPLEEFSGDLKEISLTIVKNLNWTPIAEIDVAISKYCSKFESILVSFEIWLVVTYINQGKVEGEH